MSDAGRPPRLNEQIQGQICEAIRRGNTFKAACRAGGIGISTFRGYMTKGKDAASEYREFRLAVLAAKAEGERALVECIRSAADAGDWKAALVILERRNRKAWGPVQRSELSAPGGKPLTASAGVVVLPALRDFPEMSTEDLRALARGENPKG